MGASSAVPAVCEIDGCGVLAVGRCATCKRAFCASHQGRSPDTFMRSIPYVDMCMSCMENEKAAAAKAKEEARAPFDYFDDGTARVEVLASGVPPVTIYGYRPEVKEIKASFWNRPQRQTVSTLQPTGRGWLLGMLKWRFPRVVDGRDEFIEERLTALLDQEPHSLHSDHGLTYVEPCAGGYWDRGYGFNAKLAADWQTGYGWREAMEAVKKVIGKTP